jgi:diguanylate cyclase (GGDEF)-like protein
MTLPLSLLLVAVDAEGLAAAFDADGLQPLSTVTVARADEALEAGRARAFDAVLIDVDAVPQADTAVNTLAATCAVLVITSAVAAARGSTEVAEDARDPLLAWTRQGAEDVLTRDEVATPMLARRVRAAVERKRIELASRQVYATDLATGLAHRQQLLEHLSHLLALREREPVPMALLVLRVEGFATTESRLGTAAAAALRRKLAVRLRASVRASDVVAAPDDHSYAVLLGAVQSPADAERVAAKLARSMMAPLNVGGLAVAVAVAIGLAHFPADGADADALLRRAMEMALDAPAQGRVGMANFEEAGPMPHAAANDE